MPDLNKMTMSKYSTGDNFYASGQISRANGMSSGNMGRSVMVSESMLNSRLHKVTSNQDHRIDSKLVKSTHKNLPPTDASRYRDLMIPEEELYLENLGAKYVGELSNGKPNGYGKLYFDNHDFL